MTINARFSDYVTSGAFALSLTRTQISALSMIVGGESRYMAAAAALQRKGLIEPVPEALTDNPHMVHGDPLLEWRLTGAGALCLGMLAEAGLTNAGVDVAAREVDTLRAELATAREQARAAQLRVRSMHARLEKAKSEIEILRAVKAGENFPIQLLPRDPLPDLTEAELLGEGAAE